MLILFVSFPVAISFAQQFTNYSTKDGLPSNHVYTIVQDAKGFIWFLTDKGMVKYDGKTFKTISTKNGLPINDVWDAFTTSDGKVWYLSKTAKLGYVENDTVISFPNKNKDEIINPLFTSQVGDSIYPTEPRKTFALKNNQWVSESIFPFININNRDRIKIRHSTISSLFFNAKDLLDIYDKKNNKVASIFTSEIYGKTGSRGQLNDSLFFSATNSSYFVLNLNTQKFKKTNLLETIGVKDVKYLRMNMVNDTLQVSGNGFVAKLDDHFEILNPYFFPKNIQAHFGFIDKQNTIWLATFNNGVYKLPAVKKQVKYELLNEKIQSFNVIDSNLVVGVYEKGFYTYNKKEKSFQEFIKRDDYIFEASQLQEIQTNFYSFENTLIKEVNNVKTSIDISELRKLEMVTNEIGRKFVYFKGEIYGNFSFGINRLDSKSLRVKKEFRQKGSNDVLSFKDRLLVATTNGLKEINNDSLQTVVFKNKTFSKSILSLKKIDNSHILINTDGFGSFVSDLETIKPLPATDFLIVEEAFINNKILWLATNNGVLKFKYKDNNFELLKHFTLNDGLPTNHINSIYADDTNLIVGTNNGIAILPKNSNENSQLLDVYIEKARYNNQDISDNNSVFFYEKNNNLNFTISNIDFSSKGEAFTYNYKLEPIQTDFTTTTANNFSFNNLAPGEYILYIDANSIKKQICFTIKPLWWQTFWFKAFVVFLGVVLVALISRYFVKRSQFNKNKKIFEDKRLSELQLKALRSQMNPHFVFNSLSAIQYYIGENNFEASELYLVKFSKLIRQFFALSKENEITLATEVSLLKNYLEIEKLRFKEKLSFTIYVDPKLNVQNTKIPTMLLQPIVENAVNHGVFNKLENGLVTLNFLYIDAQTFKVEIIDDGVGFVNTKKRQNKDVKSSNVLKDRLHFLNYSEKWEITYSVEELHANKLDKGNRSVFLIKKK
ncbi:histidine kinase [Lacinutrix sp. C3R15]|uniref:sensor histidine kinase n=1 Tax=Flavobacteriaceae TaxID=49546 RepID=UPI001C0A00D0|nr:MULTISPECIES: histidine kinase [Flavobacteriaceae]MBU2938770.1 histidine kinase [Lacinutrix sp. C3R15]MDO6622083.1 histidine kinase [Oceanihabitans sp. 1_MG-2023]